MDDPIVISGTSGRFPESENVWELRDHLFNGDDMVTEDSRRWPPGLWGTPRRSGKLKHLNKFDAEFFGINLKQAHNSDPQLRMFLEVAYEAIVDAGINPELIRGSNVGVFTALSSMESHSALNLNPDAAVGLQLLGHSFCMTANKVSFTFDFRGPSFSLDTGCSASVVALHQAVLAINNGDCDSAVILASNLCLNPMNTLKFYRIGVISDEGMCKSFDASGIGYVRSESVSGIYIQRKSTAKRIYATIMGTLVNNDGFKTEGQTVPGAKTQEELLREIYTRSKVNPADVVYVELHGTGTPVGDPNELQAVTNVFCNNRKGPLLIGAVKSNIGHAEAASGMCNIIKTLIAMEAGVIPANLHYKTPNPDIPALLDGRIKVISKNTTWNRKLVGINSIGFGGVNAHAILNPHPDRNTHEIDDLRLFAISGRTAESVNATMQHMIKTKDKGFFELMIDFMDNPHAVMQYPFRGYTIVNSANAILSVQKLDAVKREVWYVFSGLGSQWIGMAVGLMSIDVFKQSLLRSTQVIKPFGIDIYDLIINATSESQRPYLNNFMTVVSIQIALVDVLRHIGLEPDGIVGHSLGECGCAYADGCLTHEQTILAAYWRGQCVVETNPPEGCMAAVGLTWQETQKRCPEGVQVVCHNAMNSVTVSGAREPMKKFMDKLREEDVTVTEVDVSSVAFHSRDMIPVVPNLRNRLEKVIPHPIERSSRWISSSVLDPNLLQTVGKYASPDYYCNNLVSPVLFYDAVSKIPKNSVVIEIAPNPFMLSAIRKIVGANGIYLSLMRTNQPHSHEFFLNNLGELFMRGVNLKFSKLCPPPKYPVPSGTSMLAPLIKWDHSDSWLTVNANDFLNVIKKSSGSGIEFEINTSDVESENHNLLGHCVDGRVLFPATGYVILAWKAFAKYRNSFFDKVPVEMRNVVFNRATILPSNGSVKFSVTIIEAEGTFKITEGGSVVCSGEICTADPTVQQETWADFKDEPNDTPIVDKKDIYKALRLRGYEYGRQFQGLIDVHLDGKKGHLEWKNFWIAYLDSLLQFSMCTNLTNQHKLPTTLQFVSIDPERHLQMVAENKKLLAVKDHTLNMCRSGGIKVSGLKVSITSRHPVRHPPPLTDEYSFVPYMEESCFSDLPDVKNKMQTYYNTFVHAIQSAGKKWLKEMPPFKSELQKVLEEMKKINLTQLESEMPMKKEIEELLALPASAKHKIKESLDIMFNDGIQNILLTSYLHAHFMKPLLDIVRNNSQYSTLKVTEILAAKESNVAGAVIDFFKLQPLLSIDYTITTNDAENLTTENDKFNVEIWNVEDSTLTNQVDLVIGKNALSKNLNKSEDILKNIYSAIKPGGFALVINLSTSNPVVKVFDLIGDMKWIQEEEMKKLIEKVGFQVISVRSDGFLYNAYLIRKVDNVKQVVSLEIDEYKYESWLEDLKDKVETLTNFENLWLTSYNQPTCGIVGLVTCLTKEDKGNQIRFVFNSTFKDKKTPITLSKEILAKDLLMNVYKDGKWGHYCHIPLASSNLVLTKTAYLSTQTTGDFSSLKWFESPLKYSKNADLCTVYYSALNFRDIMLASGKLPLDIVAEELLDKESVLGLEFSGRNKNGQRVMGLVGCMGIATVVEGIPDMVFPVPDNWSLEDAATVIAVYGTVLLAFCIQGHLRKGETVLIHCGSGGVGQAAIRVALSYKCRVFTTVGTQEKREFLKKLFPQLTDESFANSRDSSFEKHIMEATNGKGVDVILNSLADEKLQATVRCLGRHGRFLEIGKYDLMRNSLLGMNLFLKGASFHGVTFDAVVGDNTQHKAEVIQLIHDGLKSGIIQPLSRTVFNKDEAEAAFRYMAAGKHVGKVLMKIRDEEKTKTIQPLPLSILAVPKFYCNPQKSYIIIGGLGGFGLELAQWLIIKGAKYLILTSRTGHINGYTALYLEKWKATGIDVKISTKNVTNMKETEELLKDAAATQGPVGGIFNLALVLKDHLLENQSVEKYKLVCDPKVLGTHNLDIATRKLCSGSLDWFVAFSSVACGQGNAGQTNYGFANSTMERICEQRREEGLHGLAIQWGVIADVGFVHENMGGSDAVIQGTLPQKIRSCMAVLDAFLCQNQPVVSSYVVPNADDYMKKFDKTKTLLESVAHILGIKDASYLNPKSTLNEIGVDSVMGIEIKQTLERNYNISLTASEVRQLTVEKLSMMDKETTTTKIIPTKTQITNYDLKELVPNECIVKMNSIPSDSARPLFLVHPVEGNVMMMENFAKKLLVPVYGIQFSRNAPTNSMSELADFYIQEIQKVQPSPPYNLAGYSFGCIVMTEIALKLQKKYGPKAFHTLSYVEGSYTNILDFFTIDSSKATVLFFSFFISHFIQTELTELTKKLTELSGIDEEARYVTDLILNGGIEANREDLQLAAKRFCTIGYLTALYVPSDKLKIPINLFRAIDNITSAKSCGNDYSLSKVCDAEIKVEVMKGDHDHIFDEENNDELVAKFHQVLAQ